MERSRLGSLITAFEQSLGGKETPLVRNILTEAVLTFPRIRQTRSDDYQTRGSREQKVICTFANHLEELVFTPGVIPPMQNGEVAPVFNLLARVICNAADGQKLLALWQKLCEVLESDSTPHRKWKRYRYPDSCRDAFLTGMMSVRLSASIMPQVLEVCTSALGVDRKPTTSVGDGGSPDTASLTSLQQDVCNFVKNRSQEFDADNLLQELDRIRKARVTSQKAIETLNRALVNVLMERFDDGSRFTTEVLRQLNRLFPKGVNVEKALQALQALKVPA